MEVQQDSERIMFPCSKSHGCNSKSAKEDQEPEHSLLCLAVKILKESKKSSIFIEDLCFTLAEQYPYYHQIPIYKLKRMINNIIQDEQNVEHYKLVLNENNHCVLQTNIFKSEDGEIWEIKTEPNDEEFQICDDSDDKNHPIIESITKEELIIDDEDEMDSADSAEDKSYSNEDADSAKTKHNKIQCSFCKKEMSCKSSLNLHQKLRCKSKNSEEELQSTLKFGCEFCQKRFKANFFLQRHQKASCKKKNTEKKVQPTKKFECEFCGKKFFEKSYVVRHQKTFCKVKNSKEELEVHKKYECEFCNHKYNGITDLDHHLTLFCKVKNTREEMEKFRIFGCEFCQMKFKRIQHLNRHQNTSCKKKFTKEELEKLRKFKCKNCDKKFNMKTHLDRHKKICPGIKKTKKKKC